MTGLGATSYLDYCYSRPLYLVIVGFLNGLSKVLASTNILDTLCRLHVL